MTAKPIEAVDPRVLYGIPAALLLAIAIVVTPLWGWLVTAAVLVLGASVTCAKARRCGTLNLPQIRSTALY
jgi:hypothetical protein